MRLARSVGFYASHEPNHHQRPTCSSEDPCTDDAPLADGWNDHADILLVKNDRRIYVDMAVTRPTTRNRLSKPAEARAVLTTPLYSCRKIASKKHVVYDEIAGLNGYRMVQFVMETYGGIASEARSLLSTLASHASDMSEGEGMTHALECLSVTLQCGNAFVSQAGMQQQLTSGVRRTRFPTAQNRYEQSRRYTRVRAPRLITPSAATVGVVQHVSRVTSPRTAPPATNVITTTRSVSGNITRSNAHYLHPLHLSTIYPLSCCPKLRCVIT
jgi:hypothetical protein